MVFKEIYVRRDTYDALNLSLRRRVENIIKWLDQGFQTTVDSNQQNYNNMKVNKYLGIYLLSNN